MLLSSNNNQLNDLFESMGINTQEISLLSKYIHDEVYSAGTIILEEGIVIDYAILIQSGAIVSKKRVLNSNFKIPMNRLSDGDIISELFLKNDPDSTMEYKAISEAVIIKIDIPSIKKDKALKNVYVKIIEYLVAHNYSEHRHQIIENKAVREFFRRFINRSLIIICLYTLCLPIISDVVGNQYLNAVTAVISIALFLMALTLFHDTQVPLTFFGLNSNNLWRSVRESAIISIIFCATATIVKYLFLTFGYLSSDFVLFENNTGFSSSFEIDSYKLLYLSLLYVSICPIEEFIIRGLLQTSFYYFCSGKKIERVIISICISNLLFSMIHTHHSFIVAIGAILPGVMWGYMYYKQKSLVGVTLSHIIIGYYIIYVLGTAGFVHA